MKPTMEGFVAWLNLNGMQFEFPYREICHYEKRENPNWSTFITEEKIQIK